jgi:hypothetical protein
MLSVFIVMLYFIVLSVVMLSVAGHMCPTAQYGQGKEGA